MDKATFNEVFKNRRVRFRPSGPITGITGNTMKCHGEVDAVICNTTVPIRILETQNAAPLIMGMNILGMLNAKINCKDKSIILNGTKYYHKDFVPSNEAEMHYTSPVSVVDELIKRHEDLFSSENGTLTHTDICEMDIDTENAPPIKQRPYRVPLAKRMIVDKEIDDMLEKQVIRPSKSRWASPVLIVPKKNNENRFCIDYRKVNAVTKDQIAVLPRIHEIFDSLGKA